MVHKSHPWCNHCNLVATATASTKRLLLAWLLTGTSVYPATLLTSAPLPHLLQAVRQAFGPSIDSSRCANGHPKVSSSTLKHGQHLSQQRGVMPECSMPHIAEETSSRGSWLTPMNDPPESPSSSGRGTSLLFLEQFSCMIGTKHAVLLGLNLQLHCGDHTLIVGPSGAGKSTFVRALAGLTPSTAIRTLITDQVCNI